MCGFVGYVGEYDDMFQEAIIKQAAPLFKHRGPDYTGTIIDDHAVLIHHRLKIIDISDQSNQPFRKNGYDKILLFNGEIYNFKEIKRSLIDKYPFSTEGDTEVLYWALIEWGMNALNKLDGEFAFAWYDSNTHDLWLARDHAGVKPLYYHIGETGIFFASELRAFRQLFPSVQLSDESIGTFLELTYIPHHYTIYRNVFKLLPGHLLYFDAQHKPMIKKWYHIPLSTRNIIDNKGLEEIRDVFDRSVKSRMIADVPIGIYLSGGIDSAVLASLISKHTDNIEAFTIGFQHHQYYDETYYAQITAKKFRLRHKIFRLSIKNLCESAIELLNHNDEPFADSSAVLTYFLNKQTSFHLHCILGGDGNDELWGGYRKYKAFLFYLRYKTFMPLLQKTGKLFKQLPQSRDVKLLDINRKILRLLTSYDSDLKMSYLNLLKFNPVEFWGKFLKKDLQNLPLYNILPDFTGLNDVLLSDYHLVLSGDMLKKVDLTSMAHSVEQRVPFLSKEMVDLAFQYDASLKLQNNKPLKWMIREAFKNELPQEILKKKKTGFEVPLSFLIEELINKYQICEVVFRSDILNEYFDMKEMKNLFENYSKIKNKIPASWFWSLIVLAYWENNEKKN